MSRSLSSADGSSVAMGYVWLHNFGAVFLVEATGVEGWSPDG